MKGTNGLNPFLVQAAQLSCGRAALALRGRAEAVAVGLSVFGREQRFRQSCEHVGR